MRASTLFTLAVGLCLSAGAAAVPPQLAAQGSDVEMRGRVNGVQPPPGFYETLARYPDAYQFKRVWKDIAEQVRARRQALVGENNYAALNEHLAAGPSRAAAVQSGAAISGTFRIPVLIGYFADSTHSLQPDTAALRSTIFGTASAPPYTVTTLYDEMSNSLLTVTGDIIGWFKVDSASTWYEGADMGMTPPPLGTAHTGDFIRELLDASDGSIDFSQYDNNSDGYVDLVAVLHPLQGGECGSSNIWAHRWGYSAWTGGSSYATNDVVSVEDYIIQSAVGGPGGCTASLIMPIGTLAHELGHGMLGLPDLYDTGYSSEGIGEWGLMGSGSWNTQTSPAHLSAWSKDQTGWVAIDTVSLGSGTGAHKLNPVISSDTALRVNIPSSTEFFLLENRHILGSDSLNGEGLLIWHVAPDLITARSFTNSVNAIWPHGVDLEQADGFDDLYNNINRGDAGDPYPGTASNTAFSPLTAPNSEATNNSDSGIRIENITLNGDKSIDFDVNYNTVDEFITTNIGAGTEVIVDGTNEPAPHSVTWTYPSLHSISVPSPQGDSLTRYVFLSWSDGGALTHSVTMDVTPDTFVATLQMEHRVRATADVTGSVFGSPGLDVNGKAWLLPTDSIVLTAVPIPSYFFVEWSGDTTSVSDSLVLHMTKPYTVQAVFGLQVAISSDTLGAGMMGATYLYVWTHVGGDPVPAGLTINSTSGVMTGVPEEDGDFTLIYEARSGALSDTDTLYVSISRPSLTLESVINHLISPVATLTPDEARYVDIIGNNDGTFDVGDFRAFLQDAGIIADLVPAELLKPKNDSAARKEEG
jgi:immune inhibitor A